MKDTSSDKINNRNSCRQICSKSIAVIGFSVWVTALLIVSYYCFENELSIFRSSVIKALHDALDFDGDGESFLSTIFHSDLEKSPTNGNVDDSIHNFKVHEHSASDFVSKLDEREAKESQKFQKLKVKPADKEKPKVSESQTTKDHGKIKIESKASQKPGVIHNQNKVKFERNPYIKWEGSEKLSKVISENKLNPNVNSIKGSKPSLPKSNTPNEAGTEQKLQRASASEPKQSVGNGLETKKLIVEQTISATEKGATLPKNTIGNKFEKVEGTKSIQTDEVPKSTEPKSSETIKPKVQTVTEKKPMQVKNKNEVPKPVELKSPENIKLPEIPIQSNLENIQHTIAINQNSKPEKSLQPEGTKHESIGQGSINANRNEEIIKKAEPNVSNKDEVSTISVISSKANDPKMPVQENLPLLPQKLKPYNTGEIRSVSKEDLCIDAGPEGSSLILFKCHGLGGNQKWELNSKYEMRKGNLCADYFGGPSILTFECHGNQGNQKWIYDSSQLTVFHPNTNKCLRLVDNNKAAMADCQNTDDTQKWIWKQ